MNTVRVNKQKQERFLICSSRLFCLHSYIAMMTRTVRRPHTAKSSRALSQASAKQLEEESCDAAPRLSRALKR
jgi:hypothetical protein